MKIDNNDFTIEEKEQLINILKKRFEKNINKHQNVVWNELQNRLESTDKLWIISNMEETGGEPDVIQFVANKNEYLFIDCSQESPKGRRSLCYDREALNSRKEFKPANSVIDMVNEIGAELLDEQNYRFLQTFGEYDLKTSSWIKTPEEIRKLGGGVFCDRRYNTVFLYHNGAESYYQARGFRCFVVI